MILDWRCPECASSGTAVALTRDDIALRVGLSHQYVSQKCGSLGTRMLNGIIRVKRCSGRRLAYTERPAVPKSPDATGPKIW